MPRLLQGRAKGTHSKAASTADTVGTAPQSHSVGAGPAICFDAGACELGARVGGVQRAGETSAPASPEGPGPSPHLRCFFRRLRLELFGGLKVQPVRSG